jgi:hypothetical protein
MAEQPSRRFFNIFDATHNGVAITTIQTVTVRRAWTRLTGQGDNDKTDTFQAKVNLQVSGTVVIQDPIQAALLMDAGAGDLAYKGETSEGCQPKQVTVTGVEFFSVDETDAHNALDGITLNWNAFNPTGADPVTVGLVPAA